MANTIEVTFTVCVATSPRRLRSSWPCRAAKAVAPTAPTAAASVGVAKPPRIEPSTRPISTSAGTMALASCASERGADSRIAGARSGWRQATHSTYSR